MNGWIALALFSAGRGLRKATLWCAKSGQAAADRLFKIATPFWVRSVRGKQAQR